MITHGIFGSIAAVLASLILVMPGQAQTGPAPIAPAAAAQQTVAESSNAVISPAPPQAQTVAEPGSDVRIIRLSQVKGAVQMDRNTGHGYEQAFVNLPVVQGSKLKTGEGVAEVEFEDNSTLRLTTDTEVEFPKLHLDPAGVTLSTIHVVRGTVYASQTSHKGNSSQFAITFAATNRVTLPANSHILLIVDGPAPRLAVFEGIVPVEYATAGGSASTTVGKKHSLLFDPTAATAPALLAGIDGTPFDAWDKEAAGYHKRYANASAFASSPGYGVSDLSYYGSFVNLPGCGSMWRPYFASAAWDPFANGVWAWYPGAGYSWVSPYPWGWTPFHAGSWEQCGTGGWGWRPGGQWVGLRNSEKCRDHLHGPTHLRPPMPPAPGHPTMIAVNARPIAVSGLTREGTFIFNEDSAGFGVPRQTFGKLNGPSSNVAHHGAFATQANAVQLSAAAHGSDGSAAVHSFAQPIAIRPGLTGRSDQDRAQDRAAIRAQDRVQAQGPVRGQNSSAAHAPSAVSDPSRTAGSQASPAHGNWSFPAVGSSRSESSGGGGHQASAGGNWSGAGGHAAAPAPSAPAASAPSAAPSRR